MAAAASDHHTGDAHYEEVALSDMVEEDGVYYYECPCGDMFEISVEDTTACRRGFGSSWYIAIRVSLLF